MLSTMGPNFLLLVTCIAAAAAAAQVKLSINNEKTDGLMRNSEKYMYLLIFHQQWPLMFAEKYHYLS